MSPAGNLTIGIVTVARSGYGRPIPPLESLRDTPGATQRLLPVIGMESRGRGRSRGASE